MGRGWVLLVGALVGIAALAGVAAAHHDLDDDGTVRANRHALHDFSHESDTEGHIEQNVNYGLRPVGTLAPAGVQDGRYTDIWAERHFAYIGTFQQPECDRDGVYVADIADPADPSLVTHIESPPDTRVNDVKTVAISNDAYEGVVLVHTLEPCGPLVPGQGQNPAITGQGGISLWDVTTPERPHALKLNFLDFGVHNTFPWTTDDGRAYLMLVDDDHPVDVHIVDITDPEEPEVISSTGLPEWPEAQDAQAEGMGAFPASFNHDVWVDRIGDRHLGVVSYWDAGWVLLDVTDPADPVFLDDSTYPDPDPISGLSPPEGNAHAAVFDASGDRVYAGGEDFNPFRLVAQITSGPFADETFRATQGTDVPQVTDERLLAGPTVFVGRACDDSAAVPPTPSGDVVAVVERGDCTFTEKAGNVSDAGYQGGIVFNSETGSPPCEALVTMLVEGDVPFLFTARSTGFKILGIEGYDPDNCPDGPNPPLPDVGADGEDVDLRAVFDGWAYFHLLDRQTLEEIGFYSPGEVFDRDFAEGFGDLSIHNMEGDPDPGEAHRAYVAWYSLGLRAVEHTPGFDVAPPDGDWDEATPPEDDYYGENVAEVGRFIAEDGSNFWGVHVHDQGDQQLVLAADRNTGIWIFAFDPSYCEADFSCP